MKHDGEAGSARGKVVVATRTSRIFGGACVVLVLALAALPALASRSLVHDLIFIFTMLTLAQLWNLLAGFGGLVSVGQQAFVGLGGYVLFALTALAGLDPLVAIIVAGGAAALVALPTALVVFRLHGAYFAIGTWVMAEVFRLVAAQIKPLGGGTGTSLPPSITNNVAGLDAIRLLLGVRVPVARDILTYWLALALMIATIVVVYLVLRSRLGLALFAIRDAEDAAESVGVDSRRAKLAVYVLAAAGAGLTGALIYLHQARISPDAAFAVLDWTAYVIVIVVIGGIGAIEGPILGVLIFFLMQRYLSDFGTWYLILLGALAIAMMLVAPKGVWGYVSERFDIALFPVRRRLVG